MKHRTNDMIACGHKTFEVGGEVFVNQRSDFAGLWGIVTDIQNYAAPSNGDETADIYCTFRKPESQEMMEELLNRFSGPGPRPKEPEFVRLDGVVMAPEMLEPVPVDLEEATEYTYTLAVQCSTEYGVRMNQLGVSMNMGALLRKMALDLKSYEIDLILANARADIDGWYFIYEAKDTGIQDLYLRYDLKRTPIFAEKGGAAA